MFALTDQPILVELVKSWMPNPSAGALATFEGWVRDYNEGREVTRLEYEAFGSLAEKEADRIVEEAKERFGITEAVCIHRTGSLEIGECSVWIGVTAPHRDAAFQACRYLIDEIKARLPIWKKEHYVDGTSGWVNCQECERHQHSREEIKLESFSSLSQQEENYYSRQMALPEVGKSGQLKLKNSRVLVVGAGGLGSAALQYLAAAGVGTLGICEFDSLEVSNLHRQVIYDFAQAGQPKAALAAHALASLNPMITIQTHAQRLTVESIESIFQGYDLVLDCTDNFEAKFLLNDAAVGYRMPLVQASIYQYEGQIHLYHPKTSTGGCLRCLWPDTPEAGCVGTCGEVGVLGAAVGVLGSMQAMEALKLLLGLPTPLGDHLMLLNLLTLDAQKIKRARRADCPACAAYQVVSQSVNLEMEEAHSPELPEAAFNLSIQDLMHPQYNGLQWVDIRESSERPDADTADIDERWQWTPGSQLQSADVDFSQWFNPNQGYILVCQKGKRSRFWAKTLRENGCPQVYSLEGGFNVLQKLPQPVLVP